MQNCRSSDTTCDARTVMWTGSDAASSASEPTSLAQGAGRGQHQCQTVLQHGPPRDASRRSQGQVQSVQQRAGMDPIHESPGCSHAGSASLCAPALKARELCWPESNPQAHTCIDGARAGTGPAAGQAAATCGRHEPVGAATRAAGWCGTQLIVCAIGASSTSADVCNQKVTSLPRRHHHLTAACGFAQRLTVANGLHRNLTHHPSSASIFQQMHAGLRREPRHAAELQGITSTHGGYRIRVKDKVLVSQ